VKHLLGLALASAWNRRLTLGLTLAAIALSVAMLLGVERARSAARESFAQSISGTDLVVGARTSPVQLMLYAVFRLGEATNSMGWKSYEVLSANPAVAWTIPLSLGDSHRGFPVLGTTPAYFEHFRYGLSRPLTFKTGHGFESLFDAVLGAEVARQLGYKQGDLIKLSHGIAEIGLPEHADKPFTVVGVLARTGTPVDRTVHVSLEAIEAIHLDWQGGAPIPGLSIPAQYVRKFDIAPKTITAALIGLKTRAGVFQMQRVINTYADEPLLAVLPGVALDQLWHIVDLVENALLAVSGMVVIIGLSGMIAIVWASLNERRRELAILRSVGAGSRDILALLALEGLLLTAGGVVSGYTLLTILSLLAAPFMQARYGLGIFPWAGSTDELALIGLVLAVGLLAALLPAWRACRLSLADGLTPRL